ncbi:MAG TPA: sugar transferase [Thermoanaerobaculia bacterium]|nr:sugar transferase [Thermoanaerobaculia bacterium]
MPEDAVASMPGYWGKRAFDVVVSLALLPFVLPLLALVWCLVRITIGSPVFFRQRRPGFRGAPFEILKFRTMTDERTADGRLLPDRARLTRIGRLLRGSSLDELPELWNVLKGEMSLVGPRPLLMEYLPHYSLRERRRHEVRPGITGLAQVSGRNAIGWKDRLALDVSYVETMSLAGDFRILVRTALAVFSFSGGATDTDEIESRLDEERAKEGDAVGAGPSGVQGGEPAMTTPRRDSR